MNRLEEQIFNEFNNPEAYSLHSKPGFELEMHYARIAAKIALELAEKAYVHGANTGHDGVFYGNFTIAESFYQFKQGIL